jgi:hypothetical protein
MNTNIVGIYYLVDEFSRHFDLVTQGHLLKKDNGKRSRNRKFTLSDSEVITILIMFHLKQFRNLKAFYTQYIQAHCKDNFPRAVSYNRFVEL